MECDFQKRKEKGYALLVVLAMMTLFSLLATSFAIQVKEAAGQSRSVISNEKAFLAADSGIQYALEAVRNSGAGVTLSQDFDSQNSARWVPLNPEKTVCFQAYSPNAKDNQVNPVILWSYGEVLTGDTCGSVMVSRIQSVRIVEAYYNRNTDQLIAWREVTQ